MYSLTEAAARRILQSIPYTEVLFWQNLNCSLNSIPTPTTRHPDLQKYQARMKVCCCARMRLMRFAKSPYMLSTLRFAFGPASSAAHQTKYHSWYAARSCQSSLYVWHWQGGRIKVKPTLMISSTLWMATTACLISVPPRASRSGGKMDLAIGIAVTVHAPTFLTSLSLTSLSSRRACPQLAQGELSPRDSGDGVM